MRYQRDGSIVEIILGIVSPIGTNKLYFEECLKSELNLNQAEFIPIQVTSKLIKHTKDKLPKSLEYLLKMEICSGLRNKVSNGILTRVIVSAIQRERKKLLNKKRNNKKVVVYYIDQLKNIAEYKILRHIYGPNYMQISLFSNEHERDEILEKRFEEDDVSDYKYIESKIANYISSDFSINNKKIETFFKKIEIKKWLKSYREIILKDSSRMLMLKDFTEIDTSLMRTDSGQQVADLFHLSDYFFNLDLHPDVVMLEVKKFLNLLFGKNIEYPTQDEFGMCLAYQASVRSSFPGDRHVGAAIISELGEVISVASIRAPSESPNTTAYDLHKIATPYFKYHDQKKSWCKDIEKLIKIEKKLLTKKNYKPNIKISELENIMKFIKNNLDFHPCTHAEISAFIDAAKLGVSVRNSVLYSTTFPCHLCAKDILNAGVSRVVYLEAYPKSKNRELYPNLIDFDPKYKSERTPFEFYCGIGPKDFLYSYSLENHADTLEIPMLEFEMYKYYIMREKDVLLHLSYLLNNIRKTLICPKRNKFLCKLIHPEK